MTASGTYNFNPGFADLVVECFERLGVFAPALTTQHLVSARRSANLLLQDMAGNRGVNLWTAGDGQLCIPLLPGASSYPVPGTVINILDAYLRQYTPASAYVSIGAALTPVLNNGVPVVSQAGDPVVVQPGSGTLSCTQGQQEITLVWPAHGLAAGAPVFWQCPVSVGGLSICGLSAVDRVIDSNTVQFLGPAAAVETQSGLGATPLFATSAGSATVDVILPNHGLSAGSTFAVQIATSVGGLTIPTGSYPVAAVVSPCDFQIDPAAGIAATTTAAFENQGRLSVCTQAAGTQWTDTFLWPLSRSDYAMLPNKQTQGRPTQYWFDRTIGPSLTVWPVPDSAADYAFVAYRMRQLQDANPVGGQTLDLPLRAYLAFTAELTAALAEKFAAVMWKDKLAYAELLWQRFAESDVEKVSTYIGGDLGVYYGS